MSKHGKRRHAPGSNVDFQKGLFFVVAGLLLIVASGAMIARTSGPFASSEVKFTDTSASGLQIVPASCPSDPHYAGECSPPPLTCGLDVSLVIDTSTSIDNNELAQMKAALKGFVSALVPETPTIFSLVSFANTARIQLPFLPNGGNLNAVNAAIDATDGDGSTNWQGALLAAQRTFDPRPSVGNLIIFASDGNPNMINKAGGGTKSVSESRAVAEAASVADSLKSSGTRIIGIGIGTDVNVANLQAIASPSSVHVTNFNSLASELSGIAQELCGGTITVKKIIDSDGNLSTTNDQTPGEGWNFSVAGVSRTTGPMGYGTPAEVSGVGPLSVAEIQQSGRALLGASCTGAANNGSLSGTTISGIRMTQANVVSCVFYNTSGASGPDLVAVNTSSSAASAGQAATLSAKIGNTGNQSTGNSFSSFFQVASGASGAGTVANRPAISVATLAASGSADISQAYTFASPGIYSVRACADKSNSGSAGVIAETNEENNCSGWVDITVTDGTAVACPSGTTLIASGECLPNGCSVGSALPQCVPQCPIGEMRDAGGQCVPLTACPPGSTLPQCVVQCPAGEVPNATGQCVPSSCTKTPYCDTSADLQRNVDSSCNFVSAGACVPSQCPLGYTLVGQACTFTACPSGTTLQDGVCTYNGCPPGYALQGGKCTFTSCPSGSTLTGGVCVFSGCTPGFTLQNGSCKVIDCPPGYTLQGQQCVFTACPSGTTLVNGMCTLTGCLPGYTLQGQQCVYTGCQAGYGLQDGQCVPLTCGPGFVAQGNTCVPVSCPTGFVAQGNSCVFVGCPVGFTLQNNACVFVACPAGWTFDGTQCVNTSCTNICSGSNLVNSCTGSLVQSCTNGCSAGGCIGTAAPTITSWSVTPTLVRVGTVVNVSWVASNVQSCTVRGTNGDGSGTNATGLWNTPTGTKTSTAISSQTIFTITCTGLAGSNPSSVTKSSTVNILPTFEENCNPGFQKVNGLCVPL